MASLIKIPNFFALKAPPAKTQVCSAAILFKGTQFESVHYLATALYTRESSFPETISLPTLHHARVGQGGDLVRIDLISR